MTVPEVGSKASDSELEIELYKSLRGEIVGYIEKVPALWLQKFVLIGSVVAFLVANRGSLDGSGQLLIVAIVAIPIISVLLDVKIGEYALHARIVSLFIHERFRGSPLAAEWESTLWGDVGPAEIRSLVRMRSLMTAVVTTVPTILLILLAGLALDQIRNPGASLFLSLSIAASILYVLSGVFMWYKIWPRKL